MKNWLFIVFLTTAVSFGVTVKGVTIGAKGREGVITTTFGGLNVELAILTLNDETVYGTYIVPTGSDNRVYWHDVERVVKGMAENYGLSFKWKPDGLGDPEEGTYSAEKNEYLYVVVVSHNAYLDKEYQIKIGIMSNTLMERNQAEEQEEANSDF